MPTPAYGIKHWWRAERLPGESLKAFARRYGGGRTCKGWLDRKYARGRRGTVNRIEGSDVKLMIGGVAMDGHGITSIEIEYPLRRPGPLLVFAPADSEAELVLGSEADGEADHECPF